MAPCIHHHHDEEAPKKGGWATLRGLKKQVDETERNSEDEILELGQPPPVDFSGMLLMVSKKRRYARQLWEMVVVFAFMCTIFVLTSVRLV